MQVKGTVRKAVGKVVIDDGLASRGAAERQVGPTERLDVKAGQRLQATVDRALGRVERVVGALVGNEEWEARGRSREAAGRAAAGKV